MITVTLTSYLNISEKREQTIQIVFEFVISFTLELGIMLTVAYYAESNERKTFNFKRIITVETESYFNRIQQIVPIHIVDHLINQ